VADAAGVFEYDVSRSMLATVICGTSPPTSRPVKVIV
jgi:hypothetical protein